MSELAMGQFWAYLGSEESDCIYINNCPPEAYLSIWLGRGGCVGSIDLKAFMRFFGTVPAPGEALLLDDNQRVSQCAIHITERPVMKTWKRGDGMTVAEAGICFCPKCRADISVRHAKILQHKRLEPQEEGKK